MERCVLAGYTGKEPMAQMRALVSQECLPGITNSADRLGKILVDDFSRAKKHDALQYQHLPGTDCLRSYVSSEKEMREDFYTALLSGALAFV